MVSNWTIGRKVTVGFVTAALALAIVGFTAYRGSISVDENSRWVSHTHAVKTELAQVELSLLEAESSVRGFVLTNTADFTRGFDDAVGKARSHLATATELTRDNPKQQKRLETVSGLMKQRIEKLVAQVTHRSAPAQTFDLANAAQMAGEGRALMQEIRDTLQAANADEQRLLDQRQISSDEASAMQRNVILVGSIVGTLVSILIGLWTATSVARQIGTAVQAVQSSSTELQAAANQQASSATEQASAMNEIATTISELLATSRQIAESSQRVSQIASQTASSARAGDQTLNRSTEASATVRKQVDQIVNHMLDLGKRSQQIGGVLDVVGELAEQTNILAINASIEAAGAGDAGRRFGVVADEIRKLADRVGGSTKEIRSMIEDVRTAVNTTVMATEAGSKAVDAGAAQIEESMAAYRQIAGLVGTTTDAAREIELSTKQQATAVEQVNVAISSVAQAARETEASATQTLQTSVRLTDLSKDLRRIVDNGTLAR